MYTQLSVSDECPETFKEGAETPTALPGREQCESRYDTAGLTDSHPITSHPLVSLNLRNAS